MMICEIVRRAFKLQSLPTRYLGTAAAAAAAEKAQWRLGGGFRVPDEAQTIRSHRIPSPGDLAGMARLYMAFASMGPAMRSSLHIRLAAALIGSTYYAKEGPDAITDGAVYCRLLSTRRSTHAAKFVPRVEGL